MYDRQHNFPTRVFMSSVKRCDYNFYKVINFLIPNQSYGTVSYCRCSCRLFNVISDSGSVQLKSIVGAMSREQIFATDDDG